MKPYQAPKKAESPACAPGMGRSMCYNPKLIAGLAVVGLGIWVLAPSMAVAALPLLLFLACPLSMWLMMRGMNRTDPGRVDDGQIPASADTSLELKARLARLDEEKQDITTRVSKLEDAAGAQALSATTKSPGN